MSLKNGFKKATREISNRIKYLRGPKGALEQKYRNTKNKIPTDTMGEIRRITTLAGIDLIWFLFCLTRFAGKDLNTLLLDNKVIDNLEIKNKNKTSKIDDSKFKKWFDDLQRTHPKASARLKLWMLYALVATMVAGGVNVSKRDDKDSKKTAKEKVANDKNDNKKSDTIQIIPTEEVDVEEEITNDESADNDITKNASMYDITSDTFEKDFINNSWNEIVVSLIEMETWREKPKLQGSESRYTYGPGLTWVYTKVKNKKGEFVDVQHPCAGKYKTKASGYTMDQIWDQVRRHSLYSTEVMPVMKRHLEKYGFKKLSEQQVLGLFVAGYQLPGSLTDNYKNKKFVSNGIIHKLSDAGSNIQKQVDAFIAGKEVEEIYRKGTNKRRWWCAMIYIGKITPDDLLEMNRDSFTAIDINMVYKNGHFVYDDATIKKAISKANNTTKGSVKSFIKNRKVPLKGSLVKHEKSKIENDKDNPSMLKVLDGDVAFNAKDYKKAIKCYNEAIALDENNMEAYSNLALAYKKLGDQTHLISDYEKSLDAVKDGNAQMNKNKSLLHDPEIKAATYFNAGLAREEMAKIYMKSNKNSEAIESFRKAKLNFETAYANAEEAENTERMEIYQNAQKRVDKYLDDLNKNENKKKAAGFKKGRKNITKAQVKKIVNNRKVSSGGRL